MFGLVRSVGAWMIQFAQTAGKVGFLALETLASPVEGKIRFGLIGQQLVRIGFGSQFVVVVTGAFVGAVFAAQTYFAFNQVGLETAVGSVVSLAMCRELGPIMTAIMVTGRVGAAMTAEIGAMKVTEQIDALRALAVHPVDYLVFPRFVGMLISMPLLIAEAIGFGLLAAYLVIVKGFGVPGAFYMYHLKVNTSLNDVGIGMIKGGVFAVIIVFICCHNGLAVTSGGAGVGKHTTESVVGSSLCILVINFFLSIMLNHFFPIMGAT
jgi:phospholipid/cholesterol/gamma-HCH transport system permease protein